MSPLQWTHAYGVGSRFYACGRLVDEMLRIEKQIVKVNTATCFRSMFKRSQAKQLSFYPIRWKHIHIHCRNTTLQFTPIHCNTKLCLVGAFRKQYAMKQKQVSRLRCFKIQQATKRKRAPSMAARKKNRASWKRFFLSSPTPWGCEMTGNERIKHISAFGASNKRKTRERMLSSVLTEAVHMNAPFAHRAIRALMQEGIPPSHRGGTLYSQCYLDCWLQQQAGSVKQTPMIAPTNATGIYLKASYLRPTPRGRGPSAGVTASGSIHHKSKVPPAFPQLCDVDSCQKKLLNIASYNDVISHHISSQWNPILAHSSLDSLIYPIQVNIHPLI